MDRNLWKSIEEVRSRESSGAQELVERTLPLLTGRFSDQSDLLSAYRQIVKHLRHLKEGDSFDDWLEAQFPTQSSSASTSPENLSDELKES